MSTQPSRPGQTEDFDEDTLRRIYDEHVDAAEVETGRVSRQKLLEEGIRKLKTPAPH